ncbi:MAG: dienelactone hydrolase family protein [Deltaproteobacteria bacterium]|nr:dienelactone hydrolase family protein [Deltaproteobacteria bacterium]
MARETSPGIRSSTVQFGSGVPAFRALPRAKGRRPAVILLHERYGVVQHTKDLTVKLAQAGYVGLAPDLFHRSEVLQDLGEAVEYLKGLHVVDPSRVAVVGICQTGRQAVLLGAYRKDLSSCVVFFGAAGGKEWTTDEFRPEPIEDLMGKLSCPVLGVFGEADHIISIDDVLRFRGCLERHKKSYHVRLYRDAPHGWLNDTMPGRYRKEQARESWKLFLSFLKKTFGSGWDRDRVAWTFESDFSPEYDFKKNVRLE